MLAGEIITAFCAEEHAKGKKCLTKYKDCHVDDAMAASRVE